MYDHGNSNDHSNGVLFTDLEALDGTGDHSIAFTVDWNDPTSGTWAVIFSKWVAGAGWMVRVPVGSSDKLTVVHTNAAGSTTITSDTDVGSGEERWMITFDDTNNQIRLYRNGVAEASNPFTMTRNLDANTAEVCIGNIDGSNQGFGGNVGQVMFWNDVILDAGEAAMYAAGGIPQRENLTFWAKGTRLIGKDVIGGRVGDEYGTVALATGDCDDYYEAVAQAPIDLTGQVLHRSRLPLREYAMTAPLEALDYELMDDLLYMTDEGLEPTGDGFGREDSPKRLVRVVGQTINPSDKSVELRVRDLSRHTATCYDQFVAPTTISEKQLGQFRVYPPGVTRTITRASSMWVPQAGGSVVQVFENEEPLTLEGLLIETGAENEILDSAFRYGVDNGDWTLINEADNGSDVADDTGDLLFEPGVSLQSCKLTAGDPLGAVGIEQDITIGAGDQALRHLSIDHKDDSGEVLSIKVQRDSDSHYRTSLSVDSWDAAETYLDLPLSQNAIARYVDCIHFSPPAGGIVYTIGLYAKSAASQVNHIYQVDFVKGNFAKYATSRIVTGDGTSYSRVVTTCQISNANTARIWRNEKGTCYFRYIPQYDYDSPPTSIDKRLITLYHDGSNACYVIYDTSAEDLLCQWEAGGVVYTSTLSSMSWSADDEIKVAIRWLQSGDLGKTSREAQMFADFGSGWVEGTVVYPAADMTQDNASALHIGSLTGDSVNYGDGLFKYLKIIPEPLHLDQIKALP